MLTTIESTPTSIPVEDLVQPSHSADDIEDYGDYDSEIDPPPCCRLFVGRDAWTVPGQIAKDGYYAGRKVFRQSSDHLFELPIRLGGLPELPTGDTFAHYARCYRPQELDRDEARLWQSFFIMGYFSKVLDIDKKR